MPRVTVTAPDCPPQPYSFDLDMQSVGIGRGPENAIIPHGGATSTNHAVMERISGGFVLRDLDSTNGTKLDDVDMKAIDLLDGTTALLGDVTFEFSLSEEEKDALSSELFHSQQEPQVADTPALPKKIGKGAAPAQPQVVAASPVRPRRPALVSQQQSSGGNGIAFVLITLVCLALGLAIRHNQEAGRFSFWEAFQQTEAPASAK